MSELHEVEVKFAGICGSDLQKINSATTSEAEFRLLGHEAVGRFEGIWVAVNPINGCQACDSCADSNEMLCGDISALGRNLPGAFSGSVVADIANIVELPKSLKPEIAVLADPLAVAIHGVKMVNNKPKQSLIIGDGVIAQLTAVELLKNYPDMETLTLTTPRKDRIEAIVERFARIAFDMQLETVVEVATAMEVGHEAIFDTTIEAVGRAQSGTLRTAIQATANNGSIVSLGVFPPNFDAEVPIREMLYKQVKLVGSNSFQRPDFRDAVAQLTRHQPTYGLFLGSIFESSDWRKAVATAETKGDAIASKQLLRFG